MKMRGVMLRAGPGLCLGKGQRQNCELGSVAGSAGGGADFLG